ncbi:BPSS1780 family membrane protein [Neisseria chenwenguii]|uniref:Uncharacterized protein n=1 Tax=Neisseria chenwenguii TaxID=1853278 RepID=A0A220S3V6_9NEIS|nr:BPSS1780 family membrane protein [Neisseria chenwenguii]ASK28086.1 hypothetical protein BG910_10415 [Neisseria chenwenguii]ROV57237.1 hypothetical protein EGS38_00675 [Neisseria chenwenguii]
MDQSGIQNTIENEAKNAPQLLSEPRRVSAGKGLSWVTQAMLLFSRRKGMWLWMTFVMILISMLLQIIPFIGGIVSGMMTFLFIGGYIFSCDALAEGGSLKFGYIFSGFKHKSMELLVLTLISGAISILVLTVVVVSALAVSPELSAVSSGDAAAMGQYSGKIILWSLLAFLLLLPNGMMVWFAPALITLNDIRPLTAMKMSFKACLRNIPAFLINILVWIVICGIGGVIIGLLAAGPAVGSSGGGEASVFLILLVIPLYLLVFLMVYTWVMLTYYTSYRSVWTDPPLAK